MTVGEGRVNGAELEIAAADVVVQVGRVALDGHPGRVGRWGPGR